MDGDGTELELFNAINGTKIGELSAAGLDYESILNYGRTVGGNKLRKMTFQERGRMLKALAMYLLERKVKYYEVSAWTGATKIDSWIDIEGGIGNLFANASLRRQFPDLPYYDWHSLFQSIVTNGYVQNEEDRCVEVCIGREGEYLFVDGRHRLAIALYLKIEKIPVEVMYKHQNTK